MEDQVMKTLKYLSAMIVSIALFFTACEKGEIANISPNPGEEGRMMIKMTDAPADYEELNVEIASVEVYLEDSGWIELDSETKSFNVLSLTNGTEIQLGSKTELDAGLYSKVKLQFEDDAELKLNGEAAAEFGGVSANGTVKVEMEMVGPEEIVIEVDEQLSAGASAEILLDFDAAQSVVKKGEEYVLDPVIRKVENTSTGVEGKVEGAAHAAIILTDGNDSLSTYADVDGEFLIKGMDPGEYKAIIYAAKENVTGQTTTEEIHVEGIVVTEGEFSNTGTIRAGS